MTDEQLKSEIERVRGGNALKLNISIMQKFLNDIKLADDVFISSQKSYINFPDSLVSECLAAIQECAVQKIEQLKAEFAAM